MFTFHRRYLVFAAAVALLANGAWCRLAGALEPAAAIGSKSQPNIVFIFADDQCFETIRTLGNDEIETPNLDTLVQRGTTFTHCYNMGSWSGAVCVASRTMLNTGRYLWRAEAVYKTAEKERKEGRFWSELMRSAGYRTYMTGKWHVPAKPENAFDVVADVRGGMPNQTDAGYSRPASDGTDPWSPADPKFGGFWQGGKHWSEVVGDNASKFLQQASTETQPFFMYLAFNAPHDPRQSPQSFVDRYPVDSIRLPENFLPEYPFKDKIGCGPGLRDEKLAPFPRTEFSVKVHRQEYYAIITHMDQQIGRILKAIEATGKAENTWIFFTADHGLAVGNHGLMGKQNLYDHSVRVPFIAVGPGVKAGARIDRPIYLQDVMPTTLELANTEKPAYVEFKSLLPNLLGGPGETPNQRPIYGAYLNLQRSIRTDQYKLIVYPQANRMRLYDMKKDPREMHDLLEDIATEDVATEDVATEDGELKGIAAELFEQLLSLQQEMGDHLDLRSIFPNA